MSVAELVGEKVRNLSEAQVQMVLAYIDDLVQSPVLSASHLMHLPAAHRRAILKAQAAKAEACYRTDPDLVCDDAEPPLSYE